MGYHRAAAMNVYLSVDMEGIGGVVHVDQTRRATGHDYEKARRWMTLETNAAIAGAFDGGAAAVLVNDSHADMRNLLLDELDPRAEVMSGALKPMSMVQGVSSEFQVALFVGYHAGASSRAGILDHTYAGKTITRVAIGGREQNEAALNAMVCGTHGVPVALVTGDETTCAQAREQLGEGVETVAVKQAITRYAARCVSLEVARARVRAGAKRAVERAARGGCKPFAPKPPHRLEVDFVQAGCVDAAELLPGTVRVSALRASYEASDAAIVLRVVQAWGILAASAIV